MPGAFKLDHLHPVKPILFSQFYNFFTFILEANSYYPRGLIMRKGNSPNSRNGPNRGDCVPGAFKLEHLHPVEPLLFTKFYNFFHFYTGRPILITQWPRGIIMRKGKSPNFRIGLDRGLSVPGAFKMDHLHPVEPILFSKFYNFFTFMLEANSYYPRGLIMRKGNSPNSRYGLDRGV